eukprot:1732203-Rhodomonas_salina.1
MRADSVPVDDRALEGEGVLGAAVGEVEGEGLAPLRRVGVVHDRRARLAAHARPRAVSSRTSHVTHVGTRARAGKARTHMWLHVRV